MSRSINGSSVWPIDLVLEAGVNHEGSLMKALEMVEAAAECKVFAIKFQTYKASKLAARFSPGYWDSSKEQTSSQIELFSKYDKFNFEDYQKIAEHCRKHGVHFATTFFDEELLEEMDELVTFHKIASADITNYRLLRAIARKEKPLLLSTGAASTLEVRNAIEVINYENSEVPITLLHCVLNYPTPFDNAHLLRIKSLQKEFPDFSVGYSDHTTPDYSELAIGIAYLFGAQVVETHFTLDKTLPGNDHYHALDPKDVENLKLKLSNIQEICAYDESKFLESQAQARHFARRGLYARVDLTEGMELQSEHVICLRPVPESGFQASHIDSIIGKKVNYSIQMGLPISKDAVS